MGEEGDRRRQEEQLPHCQEEQLLALGRQKIKSMQVLRARHTDLTNSILVIGYSM